MKKWLLFLTGFAGCWLPAGGIVFPIQSIGNQAVVANCQADSTHLLLKKQASECPISNTKNAKSPNPATGYYGAIAFILGVVFWTGFMAMFGMASQILLFLMLGSLLLGLLALKIGLRKQSEPEWRASLFALILLILPAVLLWFLIVPAVTGLLILVGYATDTFLAPILMLVIIFFLAHRFRKKRKKFWLFMWLPNLLEDFGEARRAARIRKTGIKTGG